ncbi:hypothetical protein PROFUN_04659 [Planoprotostelium fungivorum]|uniref:Uncharacterized protein n=1 Tax=Planoprotostelium fungivorum TaxID=1890364 RepID=A0A2P6NUI0_9EUKA|nr:hypothetical protein PROFUN_04659 [Planoprotostelium fungivorum]
MFSRLVSSPTQEANDGTFRNFVNVLEGIFVLRAENNAEKKRLQEMPSGSAEAAALTQQVMHKGRTSNPSKSIQIVRKNEDINRRVKHCSHCHINLLLERFPALLSSSSLDQTEINTPHDTNNTLHPKGLADQKRDQKVGGYNRSRSSKICIGPTYNQASSIHQIPRAHGLLEFLTIQQEDKR